LAIVVIFAAQILAPLGAVLVLVWARMSHTPWRKIGYVRPQSWVVSTAVGLIVGVCFKVIMKSLVMPLLGADPINHSYHFLVGNRTAALSFIPVMIVKAGFGEETFFRGYLFERLGKLLGKSTVARIITVLLTSMLFGLLHYDQGISGIEQAMITGIVFGTIFAITRELWMLMCIHTAFDLTAIGIIYWQLESKLAHLVFN
jgi:membrane protease YdiL (CAAX protease family)